MKKLKKLSYVLAIAIIAIAGCKKGDTGEQGPAGTNGTNGNANVQSFIYYNQHWVNSGSEIDVSVPAITQAVLDKGAVNVYWREAGTTDWIAIPNPYTATLMGVGYVDIYPYSGWGYLTMDVKVVVIPATS